MKLIHLLTLSFLFFSPNLEAATIKLSMKHIRSSKGSIAIGLFKDDATFQNDKAFKEIIIDKASLSSGVLNYTFQLPPGKYGIALLDDENNNEEMDSDFFGIPEEGYGFSGYDHSGMFRPSFSDFSFVVQSGKVTRVNINVDYF